MYCVYTNSEFTFASTNACAVCHVPVAQSANCEARWWRCSERKLRCGHMSLTFSGIFLRMIFNAWYFCFIFAHTRFNRQTSQTRRRRQYDNFPLIYIFNWTLWPLCDANGPCHIHTDVCSSAFFCSKRHIPTKPERNRRFVDTIKVIFLHFDIWLFGFGFFFVEFVYGSEVCEFSQSCCCSLINLKTKIEIQRFAHEKCNKSIENGLKWVANLSEC